MSEKAIKWISRSAICFVVLVFMLILAWLYPYYDHVVLMILRILLPFILAMVLSLLLHPVVQFIEELGLPRALSILVIFAVFFSLTGFLIYRGYPHLLEQLRALSEQLPHLTEAYQSWTRELYAQTERFPDRIHERLDGSFANFEAWMSARLMSAVTALSGVFNVIVLLAVIPVMTFYFLKDHSLIFQSLLRLLPVRWHGEAKRLSHKLSHSLGGYIRGQLLISLFVGFFATIGFWIAGLPYPLVLGVVAGITNIIPYFGPLLGAIPALVVAVTISVKTLIITLVAIFVIQIVEGNLLSPYIMGKSIHIHPLLIILALLAGSELAGIVGMIAAVPVLTCLKVVVEEVSLSRFER
ncbi:AI-2E family transporter [Halobacillus amylolyticus]|uniref:AI-2E family transporter n=1 Tax=Halobacillus amylolyticus TaxID=2932259 RepID=A0ABY4HCU3_9BACI|nr:AI-2E family transporter [Halobacillus amylolyticus]UOR12223.1 AI-2E family transporter [Halobacillus amylolyticus]